jgi:polyhydroxyalkanoate synthesis regulator phasin
MTYNCFFVKLKFKNMVVSESNERLRKLIDRVIDDGVITHDEYDSIMHIITEDGHIDNQERAMIRQIQEMIEDKTLKFKKG